ncbi:hypothetical protein O0882_23440 [Janthinobacterium sp. SUN073]|uniref:hypothetical protein n=1 Tax=Janthinobacterium sp. SUN073 TaxID=3004102 RepID=UPI0025B112AC|nr:hypothetical protein [Janthinobacterium sp. SUN073]MDN2699274.1 hypothetical protein [Janthinobacterium sp. SUN073]
MNNTNASMPSKPVLFQTVPLVREPQRRRDPFGFAEVATFYADLLAPDLTNRQRDARWLTILCWSLQQVQATVVAPSGVAGDYDRLRGLELRWVMEACQLPDQGKGRQLPGSRTVRRLNLEQYLNLQLEMGQGQWRRYRYVGPYAAYRSLLRHLALLEVDGWTLSPEGRKLARVAAGQVPNPKPGNILKGDPDNGWLAYWLRRWPIASSPPSSSDFLPGYVKALLPAERALITPKLFPDGSRRRAVADGLAASTARTHAELCGELQRLLLVRNGWESRDRARLSKLEQFAYLADAAIDALDATYRLTAQNQNAQPDVAEVAAGMAPELDQLARACAQWGTGNVWPQVERFAAALRQKGSPAARLQRLLRLHEQSAGGLLWLRERDGKVDRVAQYAQPPGGYYRFRLAALAHLAKGCKVISTLPIALQGDRERQTDEEPDTENEN